MKTDLNVIRILAFGDSNTWGRKPGDNNSARFEVNDRWTGALQNLLGNKYEVIEEGLNGRTTNIDSPHKEGKNGRLYLSPCVESQNPLDIVILALGKNDLKAKYKRSPNEIAKGIEECIKCIQLEGRNREGEVPTIVILSTGIVQEKERFRYDKSEVDFLGANDKSKKLVPLYKSLSDKYNAIFVNISNEVRVSEIDGVHLDASEHRKIAKVLSVVILKITS